MTTHAPNRQVSDDESRLWDLITARDRGAGGPPLRFVHIGENEAGLHPERTRQIVSTWRNEGLVAGTDNGYNTGFLTEYGREVDAIESGTTTGESWR